VEGRLGYGLEVKAGTVMAADVAITGNSTYGVFAHGGELTLERVSIADTAWQQSSDEDGYGLYGVSTVSLVARDVVVEDNATGGVHILSGADLEVDGMVVRGTIPKPDSSTGHGVVEVGGTISGGGLWVGQNDGVSIISAGGDIALSDVVATGTPTVSTKSLTSQSGGTLDLTRVAVQTDALACVMGNSDGLTTLTDVLLSRCLIGARSNAGGEASLTRVIALGVSTLADANGGLVHVSDVLFDGARLADPYDDDVVVLERVLAHTTDYPLFQLDGDLTVRDAVLMPHETNETRVGVTIGGGSTSLERVDLSDFLAPFVQYDGSSRLTDVRVRDSEMGVLVSAGMLDAERLVVHDVQTVGVAGGLSSDLTLTDVSVYGIRGCADCDDAAVGLYVAGVATGTRVLVSDTELGGHVDGGDLSLHDSAIAGEVYVQQGGRVESDHSDVDVVEQEGGPRPEWL
jgi:hypothetical protein